MASFELTAYSQLWRDRSGRFTRVLGNQRAELARRAEQLAKAAMQRLIYSIPEDRGPNGQPLWTRTRQLFNAEEAVPGDAGEVRLINMMVYARARHELGRDGRQTKRPAHWRDAIRDELREAQLRIYERAIVEEFERG